MWLLKDGKGKITYLTPNKSVRIGRKQADIILYNDSSISRTHAVINVILKDQIKLSEESSRIIIKDSNSKYGTSIIRNGIQMEVSVDGFELHPTDIIKFGLQNHIFKVEYIRFITAISRLSTEHKNQLKNIMDSIGGIIIDYYDDFCTHLTTTTATSTNKIISAIIAGIPIINIDYWIRVQIAIELNDNLPDPIPFTVPLQDKGINSECVSLKPNCLRKSLFRGKTFIFFSEKTYKEYKNIIIKAGGKIDLCNINIKNISKDLFADNNILMQISDNSMENDLQIQNVILYEKMQEKKARLITETEIPLALLYVSLDQFCNPNYHFKNLMKRNLLTKDKSEILALDTEDILVSIPHTINYNTFTSQIYIPETDYFIEQNSTDHKNIVKNYNNKNIQCIVENVHSSSTKNSKKQDFQLFTAESANHRITKNNIEKVKKFNSVNNFFLKTALSKKEPKIELNYSNEVNYNLKNINITCLLDLEAKKQNSNLKINNENMRTDFIINQKVDFNEINKNLQNDCKNHNFLSLKQCEIKKNKIIRINKCKFQKFEKKTNDFDLEKMDTEKPKLRKKDVANVTSVNEKQKKLVKQYKNKKLLNNLIESNKIDKIMFIKPLLINDVKFSDRYMKNWTTKKKNVSENNLITNITSKRNLIRSNTNSTINCKIFKKVYQKIPVNRIVLSNMIAWK